MKIRQQNTKQTYRILFKERKLPSDTCDEVISTLQTNFIKKFGCSSHRGIALLSSTEKILANILLISFVSSKDNTFPEI